MASKQESKPKCVKKGRKMSKYRRLSIFVGYDVTGAKPIETYAGRCKPAEGAILKEDYEWHVKKGDLLPWLKETRKQNYELAAQNHLDNERWKRVSMAMKRLERLVGMSGFYMVDIRLYLINAKRFTSFDYDGTVIDFENGFGYLQRSLTLSEYNEYVNTKDKAKWVHEKRLWMLEQLKADDRKYREFMEEYKKEWEQ